MATPRGPTAYQVKFYDNHDGTFSVVSVMRYRKFSNGGGTWRGESIDKALRVLNLKHVNDLVDFPNAKEKEPHKKP
jgi:hypothetical protein